MIALTSTTESLELVTSSAETIEVNVAWVDHTTSGGTLGSANFQISSATTTTIVAAPASGTARQVKLIVARNSGVAANTVTVQKDVAGTNRPLASPVLQAGEALQYIDTRGFSRLTAQLAEATAGVVSSGSKGHTYQILKSGTAKEAAGIPYCSAKDGSVPAAWVIGTPGLAGRATDGTTTADAGCIPIPNASVGANFVTHWGVDGSTFLESISLFDFLWVNTGNVVTTTTEQTVNSVAFPARDRDGGTNGVGCLIAVLVTASTSNGGAFTNMKVRYTNSAGVSNRTATLASFPVSALVGSLLILKLQDGDIGVQSIQGWTNGTSMVTGSVSLVVVRRITPSAAILASNQGSAPLPIPEPGIRLYDGACLFPVSYPFGTTASSFGASVTVMDRTL